ncbi:MAG TPA: type IV pilus modification protein PilV [Solimonas sp.]|nr:type IV pilus modification protein PilV [Solimonas sp.]
MRLSQSGASLIEVLIALVILSLGVLSALTLQLVSKKNVVEADRRSLAAYYAFDLIERIRANSGAEPLGIYFDDSVLGGGTRSAPAVDCRAATCSGDQLALFDLWDWEQKVDGAAEQADGVNAGGLPSPTVCLSGSGGLYQITIAWHGATAQPHDGTDKCGAASGRYGERNEYRRSTTIRAYVASR